MNFEQRPLARTAGVLSRRVADEIVVYDAEDDSAHLLNPTAAWIWERADGTRTVAELADSLVEVEADARTLLTLEALATLQEANLLVPETVALEAAGISRRSLLRNIGIAAMALPVVSTLAASPAAAQSVTGSVTCTGLACTGGNPTACASTAGCRCCGGGSPLGNNTCAASSTSTALCT